MRTRFSLTPIWRTALGLFLLGATVSSPLALAVDVQTLIDTAQGYQANQQWEYASHTWRAVLAQQPQNLNAITGLSTSLWESGYQQQAVETLLPLEEKHAAIRRLLAQRLVSLKQPAAAAQRFEALLKANPVDGVAFRGLKATAGHAPDPIQARALLAQVEKQSRQAGPKLLSQGRYAEALAHYDIVCAAEQQVGWENDLGLVQFLAGQHTDAAQRFQRLSRLSGEWQIQANRALVLLSLGDGYQARKLLEEAIRRCNDPIQKARLYNNLGYVYEMDRKPSKARFAYERATQLKPDFIKAWLNLGMVCQVQRDYTAARDAYQAILALDNTHAEAMNRLGFAWELLDQPKKAEKAYQEAIRLNPSLDQAYYNLGTLYKKLNKNESATTMFRLMTQLEFHAMEAKDAPAHEPTRLMNLVELFFAVPLG
jgi:tetratricopeptide (TPR) repeat protein